VALGCAGLLLLGLMPACREGRRTPEEARLSRRRLVPLLGLPGVFSEINADGPVVTPAQARAIVEAFWPLREDALANDDVETTDLLEDGIARVQDDALSLGSLYADRSVSLRRERPFTLLGLLVARQDAFPARFLAEVRTVEHRAVPTMGRTPDAPRNELLVFTRQSAQTTWRLSLVAVVSVGGSTTTYTRTGTEDFAPNTPLPAWTDPAQAHARLAAYWQEAKDTGAVREAAGWHPLSGEVGEARKLAAVPQGAVDPVCDCTREYHIAADPDVYLFPDLLGKTYTCSTVRTTVTSRGTKGRQLLQDPKRHNWGALVAPGRYRSISLDEVIQSCIIVNERADVGVTVVGQLPADVAASTER
jgi:hypothetical protein